MRMMLRSIGVAGVMLFGLLFSVTFLSPQMLEESAKGFVQSQIEKEVRTYYTKGLESDISNQAKALAGRLGLEQKRILTDLENDLPGRIAATIAAMCGYDCEKRKALAQSITVGYLERISEIELGRANLGDIVRGKYLHIVGKLKTDLRIFLGSNALMFLALLSVSVLRSQVVAHLFLPALLLLLATLISSSIYVFGQDWFYTILYDNYLGFTYLAYLGMIFALLLDIALNRARVTTSIINRLADTVGSSVSLVPC